MCDLLIRYPVNNQLWLISTTDTGQLMTSPINVPFAIIDPSLIDSNNNAWELQADSLGRIVATNIGAPLTTSVSSATLVSEPTSLVWNLAINASGMLTTTYGNFQPNRSIVPRPIDVAMSQWPDGTGVICPQCGGATVTVSADMSCWCCACNTFVNSEDTTIIIVLSE